MSNVYNVFNTTSEHEFSRFLDKLDLTTNELINLTYIAENNTLSLNDRRTKILELMAGSSDGNYELCVEQFRKSSKQRVLKESSQLNLNQIMELNDLVTIVANKLSAPNCMKGLYNIIKGKLGSEVANTFIGMVQQSSVNDSNLKFNTDLQVNGKNLADMIYQIKNEIEMFANSVECEKEEVTESVLMERLFPELKSWEYNDLLELTSDNGQANAYTKWLGKLFIKGEVKIFDKSNTNIKDIISSHKRLRNAKKVKDIMQYSSWKEMENDVENKLENHIFNSDFNQKAKKGFKIIANEGSFILGEINNREAAMKYGKGTKWCTSSTNDDRYFNYYKNEDEGRYLFYLIDKNDSNNNLGIEVKVHDDFIDIAAFNTTDDYKLNVSIEENETGENILTGEFWYDERRTNHAIKYLKDNKNVYFIIKEISKYFNRPVDFSYLTGKNSKNIFESYSKYKQVVDEISKVLDDVSNINVLKTVSQKVDELFKKVKNMNEANQIAELKSKIETKLGSLTDTKPQIEECVAQQVVSSVCEDDTFNGLLQSLRPTVINITVNKEGDMDETICNPEDTLKALASHINCKKSDCPENNIEELQTVNTLLTSLSNYFETALTESVEDKYDIGDTFTANDNASGIEDKSLEFTITDIIKEDGEVLYKLEWRDRVSGNNKYTFKLHGSELNLFFDKTTDKEEWDGEDDEDELMESVDLDKDEVTREDLRMIDEYDISKSKEWKVKGMDRTFNVQGYSVNPDGHVVFHIHYNGKSKHGIDDGVITAQGFDEMMKDGRLSCLTQSEEEWDGEEEELMENNYDEDMATELAQYNNWEDVRVNRVDGVPNYDELSNGTYLVKISDIEFDDDEAVDLFDGETTYVVINHNIQNNWSEEIDVALFDEMGFSVDGFTYEVVKKLPKTIYNNDIDDDYWDGEDEELTEAIIEDFGSYDDEYEEGYVEAQDWFERGNQFEHYDNDEVSEDWWEGFCNGWDDAKNGINKFNKEFEKINEDTVYDHSWYEVKGQKYPKRTKNGVEGLPIKETASVGATCAGNVSGFAKPLGSKPKKRKKSTIELDMFKESVQNGLHSALEINGKMVAYRIFEGKGYLYINNAILKATNKEAILEAIDDIYNDCLETPVLEGFTPYQLEILMEDDMNTNTIITPEEKKEQQEELDSQIQLNPNLKVGYTDENSSNVEDNQELVGVDDSDMNDKKYVVRDPQSGKVKVANASQIKVIGN